MPSILNIIRRREHRRNRNRRSAEGHAGRVLFGAGFVLSALMVLGILATALAYAGVTSDLPSIENLPILLNTENGLLLQPTRIYDRSGQELLDVIAPIDEPRMFIAYDQFPKSLVDATLAVADPKFWKHGGYQVDGWRDAESHPTLAQQLAEELLLWDEEPTARRALRERLLAAQMTKEYGREQVVEWYLNSADYGYSAYGAESAARLYFGKPVTELTLNESALLAAVSQSPALNPFDAAESAESSRLQVLDQMLGLGLITQDEAGQAKLNSPKYQDRPDEGTGEEMAFINLVLEQLGQRFDDQRVRRGGLVIITSMDRDLQRQVTCTIRNELARLAGESTILEAEDGSDCMAARYLPVPDPRATVLADATASALILDAENGQVLAVVGDMRSGNTSAYIQTHPAGTMLTPFLYLTGFTRGLSPASLSWDIPGSIENFDGQYHGPVRLRTALVNDYLPPAEAILDQMGTESIARIAASFGLNIPAGTNPLKDEIPLSLLDAAAAYGVFANQGTLAGQELEGESIRPATVLEVTGVDGKIWADWTSPGVQAVVSPQLAYLMTDVLRDDNVRQATLEGVPALDIQRPAAVKVARTFSSGGAWTAGYTPQRVVVVHMQATGTPLVPAMDLWHALISYAVQDLPEEGWTTPAGITVMQVCDPSGMLPTEACQNMVREVFLSGNEPVQGDTLYQIVEVNRETGLLATVFTRSELVEERTFMIVPAEASAWAEGMGIAVPPTEYDVIQTMETNPDVTISSPALFAEINGQVEVRGTAAGANFASFRLEYGRGLNPHEWIQIGTDSNTAISAGVLGTWDTTGLDGLVVLRLMVVRTDQRVEQAVTVVTISTP